MCNRTEVCQLWLTVAIVINRLMGPHGERIIRKTNSLSPTALLPMCLFFCGLPSLSVADIIFQFIFGSRRLQQPFFLLTSKIRLLQCIRFDLYASQFDFAKPWSSSYKKKESTSSFLSMWERERERLKDPVWLRLLSDNNSKLIFSYLRRKVLVHK